MGGRAKKGQSNTSIFRSMMIVSCLVPSQHPVWSLVDRNSVVSQTCLINHRQHGFISNAVCSCMDLQEKEKPSPPCTWQTRCQNVLFSCSPGAVLGCSNNPAKWHGCSNHRQSSSKMLT